MTQLGVTE
jgi:hypothetical protein